MALSASIFKLNIFISNMDTNFYQEFDLTMAQHPSESEARMMYRLLAFIHSAHDDLKFTQGLSNVEEPELWQMSLTGEVIHWIELGLPDEKRIKQAAGKSKKVSIYTYHKNKAEEWFPKIKEKFLKNDKINIYSLEVTENGPIEALVEKSMKLTCVIEDNLMYLASDDHRIGIQITKNL
jgi:uncharacterized protein YaeQ